MNVRRSMPRILIWFLACLLSQVVPGLAVAADRPSILWITCEDIGPHLGAYGDPDARTPNLDRLASRGLLYLNAWSNAPVCAPARTTIISGLYPTATGSEHMRSQTRLPVGMLMYPQYLREAGYYCTNNSKEDYNLEKPGKVWDESSGRAHWKHRGPGQPFFAVFNHTVTHESQVRNHGAPRRGKGPDEAHDPAKIRIPAYHPDTPEVRRDWAKYHDNITEMDALAGANLREVDEAGLADQTIVFFYGDHGPGLPRCKRYPCNSGLRVPLIVHIPEKFRALAPQDYRAGGKSARLVAFVDLAPTLLSLAGIRPPAHLQGRAFLGPHAAPPPEFLHGFRGRMDERYDLVRSVRDERYVYIRNYMPHEIYGQHVSYMFETPTTRVWKKLHDEGRLPPEQDRFWRPKPPEELYDLETDPEEVRNLADSAEHRRILERLRRAQRDHALAIRDVGFLPEGEIHERSRDSTPYEMGHDGGRYPLERILATAELASGLLPDAIPDLRRALSDPDSAVRWWGALGILMRGEAGAGVAREELRKSLADPSPYVRVTAAEAIALFGAEADLEAALDTLIALASVEKSGLYVSLLALNAIDALDSKAARLVPAIEALPRTSPSVGPRMESNVPRLIEKILADLKR